MKDRILLLLYFINIIFIFAVPEFYYTLHEKINKRYNISSVLGFLPILLMMFDFQGI